MAKPDLQLERIKELVAVMREAGVSELSIELPDLKISLKREASASEGAAPAAEDREPAADAEPAAAGGLFAVVAPMVGIFRAASARSPQVSPGDSVSAGQVIGAIEAMKVANDIPSPVAGVVREVVAGDGAAVEYGQPLMLIEPAAAREGAELEAEAL